MGNSKLSKIAENFVRDNFSADTYTSYVDWRTFGTLRYWNLKKFAVNSYDPFIRLVESEYEKPHKIGTAPSISFFIVGKETGLRPTLASLSSVLYAKKCAKYVCSEDILEADRYARECESEYLAFVQSGIILRERTLYECMRALSVYEQPGLIYSDEDHAEDNGMRKDPFFKPDYAPDLLMSFNYYGGFVLVSKKAYIDAGGLIPGVCNDPYYDLWLRISENEKVGHIDRILFHRTIWFSKSDTDVKAVSRAMERRGTKGSIRLWKNKCIIEYKTGGLVSVIIPSKDNPDLLSECLSSVDEKTLCRNYELIIVDNGSSDENRAKIESLCKKYNAKYIYEKKDFNFSHMCNLGAAEASGDVLLFLNDDIKITQENWLEVMAGQARLPYSGAVGCLLVYPGGKDIQHCGTKDREDGPGHIYQNFSVSDPDCADAFFPNNVNGVTAACLAIRKEVFESIGRFDENLSVCYNDVALCFDLINAGYVNCVRGDVCLVHAESVSRGYDAANEEKLRRLIREQEYLYQHHALISSPHPFYNVNMTNHFPGKSPDYTKWLYDVKTPVSAISDKKKTEWEKAPARNDYKIFFDELDAIKYVHIFGWAYADEYYENFKLNKRFVLYNDEHTYIAYAKDWYRKDLSEGIKRKDLEFCGFRAKFDRDLIEPGTYHLSFWTEIGKCDLQEVLIR